MMWGNEGGYGMFFGPLFMILILAATIAAIVFLVRWLSGAQQGFGPTSLTPPCKRLSTFSRSVSRRARSARKSLTNAAAFSTIDHG